MRPDPLRDLSPAQQALVNAWIPGATVVRDHSWGLVQTYVLQLADAGGDYILKAGGPQDGHIARELRAHREWLSPWTSIGRAPELVNGDEEAKLILTRFLPGHLAQETPAADEPDTYRQAGDLLARFHGQGSQIDTELEQHENDKALRWLAGPHRIPAAQVARLRAEVDSWPTPPCTVVPTHGDWQTRNWLTHDGTVYAIDFGRAALRPALTDWIRLSNKEFRRSADIERAFVEGYGGDPREPEIWRRTQVREAVGTACWAHAVGDEKFEAHGLHLIGELLAL